MLYRKIFVQLISCFNFDIEDFYSDLATKFVYKSNNYKLEDKLIPKRSSKAEDPGDFPELENLSSSSTILIENSITAKIKSLNYILEYLTSLTKLDKSLNSDLRFLLDYDDTPNSQFAFEFGSFGKSDSNVTDLDDSYQSSNVECINRILSIFSDKNLDDDNELLPNNTLKNLWDFFTGLTTNPDINSNDYSDTTPPPTISSNMIFKFYNQKFLDLKLQLFDIFINYLSLDISLNIKNPLNTHLYKILCHSRSGFGFVAKINDPLNLIKSTFNKNYNQPILNLLTITNQLPSQINSSFSLIDLSSSIYKLFDCLSILSFSKSLQINSLISATYTWLKESTISSRITFIKGIISDMIRIKLINIDVFTRYSMDNSIKYMPTTINALTSTVVFNHEPTAIKDYSKLKLNSSSPINLKKIIFILLNIRVNRRKNGKFEIDVLDQFYELAILVELMVTCYIRLLFDESKSKFISSNEFNSATLAPSSPIKASSPNNGVAKISEKKNRSRKKTNNGYNAKKIPVTCNKNTNSGYSSSCNCEIKSNGEPEKHQENIGVETSKGNTKNNAELIIQNGIYLQQISSLTFSTNTSGKLHQTSNFMDGSPSCFYKNSGASLAQLIGPLTMFTASIINQIKGLNIPNTKLAEQDRDLAKSVIDSIQVLMDGLISLINSICSN
ncbi:hypothetical protein AYI69_g5235 [Smittium culicis]|uniref:Uncharacterized protein n=1 Tax=Smittium culicis TaxID=133412 RepID=A0A1R1Y778_9FUNG|nr:hypothetical protein AYI69_g5235 [Smittium culicis]